MLTEEDRTGLPNLGGLCGPTTGVPGRSPLPFGMASSEPGRPVRTERLVRAAAARAFVRDLVGRAGWALVIGAAAALLLVAADKVAGGLVPWAMLIASPLAVALLIAVVWSLIARWSPLRAAIELDRTLGLKDRLSSALEFATAPRRDDPFVTIAVREAEEAADKVRLDRAVPIRFDGSWIAWPILGAAAVAVGIWAPWVVWEEPRAATRQPVASRTETAADVAQAAEAARAAVESSVGDIATPEQLRTLEELHEQLVRGEKDPDGARIEASRAIDDLARDLARSAERERLEQDRLREELAQLAEAESGDGPAAALAEAMRQGDLEAGRRAVRELMEQADTLPPHERERLAQDLERMSRPAPSPEPTGGDGAADPRPNSPDGEPGDAGPSSVPAEPPLNDEVRRDLEQQGLTPEQTEQIARETDPRRVEDQLREAGVEPSQAERLAERVARENQRREAEAEAQRQLDEMRESMRQAAEDLRRPSEGSDREPRQPGEQRDPRQESTPREGQEPSPDPSASEPRPRPDGTGEQGPPESQPAAQPGERPDSQQGSEQQPGTQPQQGEGDKPGEGQGQQPAPAPGESPGRQNPGGQQQVGPSDQPGARQQPGAAPGGQQGEPRADGERQPGGDRTGEGAEPGAEPAERSGERPSGEGSPRQPGSQGAGERQPGAQQGQPGEQPASGGDEGQGPAPGQGQGRGLERLSRQFERLAREAQGAEQDAEKAQRLREAAQKLLEESTPEEREQLRRWAEKMREEQQRGGRPFPASRPWSGTETVDARPEQEAGAQRDERVVAQWFSDEPAPRDGRVGRASAAEQVRRAAESAERSVESQPISSRHREFVRRVFRRYAERAEDSEMHTGPERR